MSELPLARSGRGAPEVAIEAVRGAGETLKASFRGQRHIEVKGRGNIVTDADLRVEKALTSLLSREYPNFAVLGEESPETPTDSPYTWVVDPLDGTNNYTWGIPFWAVVLALARGNEVLLGLIYDPLRDELFRAEKGKGAFLNEEPMRVSATKTVPQAIIGTDLGYVDENGNLMLELMGRIWPGMHAMRIMGSGALGMAYAACGRLDIYFHPLLYPWELGCGGLLVVEAGGKATDWQGNPLGVRSSSAIAANEALHGEIMRLVNQKA